MVLIEFLRLKVHEGHALQTPINVLNDVVAAKVGKVRKEVARVIDMAGTNMLTQHQLWYHRRQLIWEDDKISEPIPNLEDLRSAFVIQVNKLKDIAVVRTVPIQTF